MMIGLERSLGGRIGIAHHSLGMTIIKDTQRKGVWPIARQAWHDSLRYDSTHHLVLQDDIVVCRDFLAAVVAAIEARPDAPVAFFDMSRTIPDAMDKGVSWAVRRSLSSACALAMPTPMVLPAIRWCDYNTDPKVKSYDARLSAYFLSVDQLIWYTVPSLVDHNDNGHSLIGHPVKLPSGKKRVASAFIGAKVSGLTIDWTKGLDSPHRGWSHTFAEYRAILKHAIDKGTTL